MEQLLHSGRSEANICQPLHGATAKVTRQVPATILGGLGSIAIALLWMWLFPSLKELDNVNSLMADEAAEAVDESCSPAHLAIPMCRDFSATS